METILDLSSHQKYMYGADGNEALMNEGLSVQCCSFKPP